MNDAVKEKETAERVLVVGLHSATYNLFILALILFSLINTLLAVLQPDWNEVLWRVDILICVVLLYSFLRDLWLAPDKTDYFFRQGGWLDLLGTVPAVLGLHLTMTVRLARLNKAIRIARHLRGKDTNAVVEEAKQNPARTILYTTIISALVLITVTSLLVLPFERGSADATIVDGDDAIWWAIVTITTVGYGDYVPVTFPGRVLAIVLMMFGTGIFAVLTSFLASKVVTSRERSLDREQIIETIQAENAVLRREMGELRQLLTLRSGQDDE